MKTAEQRMGRGLLIGLVLIAIGLAVVGLILWTFIWALLKLVGLL